jgi:hypothetical protein
MINPTGKYIYETSNCCVNLYAVDPTSGSLTPTAHLRLGEPGDFSLRGFAMDPTDKFAYALDRNRIYGFRIDAATGRLKGLGQAIGAGDSPETIALDPTGAFAYVVDSGSRTAAPTIYAYRIEGANGKLIPLPHSPFMVAAAMTDPIAHSFNAGECSAFSATPWSAAHPPPVARDKSESLILPHVTSVYSYDSTSRTALHYPHADSGFTITARLTAAPPPSVSRSDLSTLRTTSGIKLGSSAAAVIRALGRPKIVNGCGQQRYVYTTDTEQSLFIQFTITNGRVTEISEDLGG